MISNRKEDLNFDLGETVNMIRETVKNFSDNEIAPRATEIDKKNDFPSDLWEKMGKLGILGVTVEEKWGGSGLGYLEHIVVVEEISRASVPLPTAIPYLDLYLFIKFFSKVSNWLPKKILPFFNVLFTFLRIEFLYFIYSLSYDQNLIIN